MTLNLISHYAVCTTKDLHQETENETGELTRYLINSSSHHLTSWGFLLNLEV